MLLPTATAALVFLSLPAASLASGVVTNCTDADLRAALSGGGTVTFACDGVIALTNPLVIAANTILDASGRQVTLSGGGTVRPFWVNGGVQLTLQNLTVANGLGANSGGAMVNHGLTRLIDCTFSNNAAVGSVPTHGGAVYHGAGRLDVSGCAFLFNRAVATNIGGGPGISFGGAISGGYVNPPAGPLNVTNCTFFGNSASSASAIAITCNNGANGPANLLNSTFAGNSNGAVAYCVGLPLLTNRMVVMNSIFASNNGANCSGVTDGGYNISSDASGGFTHPFSLQNVDPRLGPLADYGGPTLTVALLPDSPAIDGGSPTAMTSTDQRRVARPFGASSDAGAYEFTATGTSPGVFQIFATTNLVGEAGGSVAFTVIRAGGTTGEASVSFATGNGTATAGLDFVPTNGVLTFGDGQQSNTVSVTVLEDSAVEGNETFNMALTNPTGGASLGRAVASLTIADNDSSFQFSSANYSVGEGAGSFVATITRAGNSDGIQTVEFTTLPGAAITGGDFIQANGQRTFAPGQTSATFTVTIIDDFAPEPAETLTLQLLNPTSGAILGTPAVTTLTIIDNETVQSGALRFSVASNSVSEANGEVLLTVVRAGGTNGVVTADFTTSAGTASAGSDFTPTNGTLVFGDTETRQFIRVPIMSDLAGEGPESFSVVLSNPSGGATLGNPAAAAVTILDGTQALNSCDESSLRAAVSSGGHLALDCDGTILLTSPLVVSNGLSIDGSGHSVAISGGNATRLFVIQPGVALTLRHLALVDGLARGTNGGTGLPGEPAQGAAICNSNGVLNAYDCTFERHLAQGGNGGPGSGGFPSITGNGGAAAGGAIYNWLGLVNAEDCLFSSNRAVGGTGGISGSAFGFGGDSRGGAICNVSGSVHLAWTVLSNNVSLAGQHRRFGTVGGSAAAFGGGFHNLGDASLVASRVIGNVAISEFLNTASGGGISHQAPGSLSLSDCTVRENRALGGAGMLISTPLGVPGQNGSGGGVHIGSGEAFLTNSTLANNLAIGGAGVPNGAAAGLGGGMYNAGAVHLDNCTIAQNVARGGQGRSSPSGNGEGGGLYNNAGGSVVLTHATVAANTAEPGLDGHPAGLGRGGAISSAGGSVTLRNSILAYSLSGSNCFGTGFVDEGHNISSDASCNFAAPGSVNSADPLLGPLADYGGPTPTMALLAGSPALDAADAAFCPATDQRGTARPFGAGCDIGAFESAPPYTVLGQVHGFTTPASGIQIASPSGTTAVPPGGQFAVHGLAAGTHLLAISSPECVLVPRTRSVTVGPDVVDVSFLSYRSNALVIERFSGNAVRCVFAGEAGATYRVLSSTELSGFAPYSTNQTQSNGLFEFSEGSASPPKRFFQVVRP